MTSQGTTTAPSGSRSRLTPDPLTSILHRYAVSVLYLRPAQVVARIATLARRQTLHRLDAYRRSHAPPGVDESVTLLDFPDSDDPRCVLDGIDDGIFTFLNRPVALGRPVDWLPEHESRLWIYNLHYFDYAVGLARDGSPDRADHAYSAFRDLASDWMRSCPCGTRLAWDPYPLSLRVCNWIRAYTLFQPALGEDPEFSRALRRSLYQQTRFLANDLEYGHQGNHLLENARALVEAGLFFSNGRARQWLATGERILWTGIRRQFLTDGGHFERSPMYHQIMMKLYREAVHVLVAADRPIPEEVGTTMRAMETWLANVVHPDGDIALLNDAALGIAGRTSDYIDRTSATDGLQALPDSGYFTFRDRARGSFLVMDCGLLRPDYQPGHGHCDALSFELSVAGQRMIVDSGVDDYYGELEWRQYYRSTRAHNTVVVDGEEQSELWDRFRVARRARPFDIVWKDDGPTLACVAASHTGYRRLTPQVTHRRWLCWIGLFEAARGISGVGRDREELALEAADVPAPDDETRPRGHPAHDRPEAVKALLEDAEGKA